jgi:hypothetical protein
LACLEFANSRRALEYTCRDFFCVCRQFFSSCRDFEWSCRDVFHSCRDFGKAIHEAVCPIPGRAHGAQEAKSGKYFPFSPTLPPSRPSRDPFFCPKPKTMN